MSAVEPKRTLSPLENVAPNTTQIDLEYLGQLQMIASCLLEGEGGTALVDPGPASALDMLRAKLGQRGLSVADVDHLVLTHIRNGKSTLPELRPGHVESRCRGGGSEE